MNKPTVFIGKNILQSHVDVLQPLFLYDLCEMVRGNQDLMDETDRIRKVARMDMTAYQRVKTRLPYFCCATFSNGIRKSENFTGITCFVIDIDKLNPEKMESLKQELRQDTRVKMLYVSPGGKGIKAVFELAAECCSLKDYSDFYKTFAYHLSETYHLQDFLDASTCDATRVTFLCHDPDAFYNTLNEPVNLQDFLPGDIFRIRPEEKTEGEIAETGKKDELPEDLYKDILKKLNPSARIPAKQKQIFIPEELNRIQIPVTAEMEKLGIAIKEVRDINYGKKFIFSMGFRIGEVNLFFGMKGFSVVQSPKSGTDARLNDLGEMVIRKVLAEGEDLLKSKPEAVYTLN